MLTLACLNVSERSRTKFALLPTKPSVCDRAHKIYWVHISDFLVYFIETVKGSR